MKIPVLEIPAFRSATLLKRLQHRCFPWNIVQFLRTFFTEHLQWLVLVAESQTLYLTHFSPYVFRGYRNRILT